MKKFFAWLAGRSPETVPAATPAPEPVPVPKKRMSDAIIAMVAQMQAERDAKRVDVEPYIPPDGVIPPAQRTNALAMDSTPYDFVNGTYYAGEHFRGYPYLAMLSQQPEFRKMSETIATQMCRKWIEVVSKGGDEKKADKVAKIEAALERFKVRDLFRDAAQLDGFFGRGQIYIDVNKAGGGAARDDPAELDTPLLRSAAKIPIGALRGFTLVEPVWTYPNAYNSNDPLAPNYYKPSSWFVMGKVVHSSRLLMFVSRPVPDLLKAPYNFGGLSLTQLAERSVNNWVRTSDSVSDMVHSYSLTGIKTNLMAELSGDGAGGSMNARADLFNLTKDNRGLMMMDFDTEEMFQFNTPLSGLDKLQSQAQEQPAAISNIPLVFLLGITPSGLNATSEGEIEVFYSYISGMQEKLFSHNLNRVFEIIQLNEFGAIDPDITFKYLPLSEMDPEQLANIQKTKADTDAVLINAGTISPDESRDRLASDPENDYAGLPGNAPELPDDDPEGGKDA